MKNALNRNTKYMIINYAFKKLFEKSQRKLKGNSDSVERWCYI